MKVIVAPEPGTGAIGRRRPLSLEVDTRRGGVAALRNVLFGLWAARRLGLPQPEHETYAWSVHFADLEEPGDADVIAKVRADLEAAGSTISEALLRHHLREMELRAYFQLSVSVRKARRTGGRRRDAARRA